MEPQMQPGMPPATGHPQMGQHPPMGQPDPYRTGNAPPLVAHTILHGPSFAMLRVDLQPGQTVVAEAGAMVARNTHIGMEVKLNAGKSAGFFAMVWALIVAFIRRLIGGETFFVNHFKAERPGSVWLAPTTSGQIAYRRLRPGEKLVLSSGAYLASSGDIDVQMKWGGLSSILAKEGAFMLEVSGDGDLWFTSYGGITEIHVNGSYIVDNGHLVGYEGSLTMSVRTAGGGVMGFVASGEGLVCEFKGQGRLFIQSRNLGALVDWLSPLLPS